MTKERAELEALLLDRNELLALCKQCAAKCLSLRSQLACYTERANRLENELRKARNYISDRNRQDISGVMWLPDHAEKAIAAIDAALDGKP